MTPAELKALVEAVQARGYLPLSYHGPATVIEHETNIYHAWTNHTTEFYRYLVAVGNLAPLLLELWEAAEGASGGTLEDERTCVRWGIEKALEALREA